jgi:hypothetical protein
MPPTAPFAVIGIMRMKKTSFFVAFLKSKRDFSEIVVKAIGRHTMATFCPWAEFKQMLEIKKIFESGTEFRIMIPTDWLVFA